MDIDSTRIQQLIERPVESLSVELKRWLDPAQDEHKVKIIKAALALRNHGGGYLVIGFDNETLQPDIHNVTADVRGSFHLDIIQGIISKYASEPFEISVEFPERDGQAYPVIVIPSGVRTPVAAKSTLNAGDRSKIETGDVYIRSLNSNNTPSSTKAGWKDWPAIVEKCFDNREADIGRFLRRHLSGVTPELLREFATSLQKGIRPEPTTEELLQAIIEEGQERYSQVVANRNLILPEHGTWETALKILGKGGNYSANLPFLNLLESSNPDYTGWPVWVISRGFHEQADHPYVYNGAWEELLVNLNSAWGNLVDFMRLDPKGEFYHRRALEDDRSSERTPEPLKALDFSLAILRVAEAIAVGLAFAKAMEYPPENTMLAFAFRWKGLQGRMITSWANTGRYISPGRYAYQDEVTVYVNVPADTPLSALSDFVYQAIEPLFAIFGGFAIGKNIVEDLTNRLLYRRL